jgi:hypothetical protein
MQSVLFWGGLALALLAGIRLVVLAFNENVWWGVACLIVPGVLLLYGFLHWHTVKKPFLVFLAGLGAMLFSTRL